MEEDQTNGVDDTREDQSYYVCWINFWVELDTRAEYLDQDPCEDDGIEGEDRGL